MFAKIKKWFIELILITLAISGCTRAVPVNVSSLDSGEKDGKGFSLLPDGLLKKNAPVTPPGDYVQTINVESETLEGAKTRSYALHVPPSYDGTTLVPLVIMLHSVDANANALASASKFNVLSDTAGFLLVYPDAFTQWNPGFYPASGANDVAFISALIDHMLENFYVDPKFVFVGGYFDGGMMAYKLAANLPEKIAAVGAYGSTIGYQVDANQAERLEAALAPVSAVIFHGAQDQTVPYKGSKGLSKGNPGFLPGYDAVTYWMTQNNCDPNGDYKVKQNENIIKNTFTCQNNTTVKVISIQSADHYWPTIVEKNSAKKAMLQYDVSKAMWEFFITNPRQ